MLTVMNALGVTTADLVCYMTSGDVTGERDRVVGYAGMVFGEASSSQTKRGISSERTPLPGVVRRPHF
jgi:hypothetical protein